ncbi:ABC transporter ATP-binding protein [Nocardia bhagyanarayanae]|uniref:NitT/TauT family transport system ATP-binding protein/taurine transport system ATP-binding protein n=1 Tax=Nocardia bhagyanarayanae TaxID=1215925 RepID=A0A543FHG6_9NOCA|nr:ABC transporter ATP-binding protein [Nocardia bhagyanarayanae]TQM33216.1 NitT/TauT family transport system ATP-binding protein/taurine transport system ATP-binding protein [Nocardia bhagyanarayanae]
MIAGGIELSSVTVGYGDRPVLADFDLRVEPGSFLAVLGPSGCGKSTLLNCVAGFVRPVRGRACFDGAEITGPGRERGVVFQRDVLFPWATVARNLGFALRAARVPRTERRERIAELLTAVGLPPEVAGKLPHELSGGMRQRVGIARALAIRPRVLLMDEPFGALDAQTRTHMQDLVVDLWQSTGTTIVFVTHDVEESIRIASDILVLRADGIVADHLTNPLPRPRPASSLGEFTAYPALRKHLYELLRPPSSPAPTGSDRPVTTGEHP